MAGATAGSFLGVLLGTVSSSTFLAMKSASGAVIIVSETAATVSPGLVPAFSAVGTAATSKNTALVAKIAGLPVVEAGWCVKGDPSRTLRSRVRWL